MHLTSYWLHQTVHCLQAIHHAGWLGWVMFIGLYALACLFFIPGSILTLGAGATYGFWVGVLLVLLGNGLGSLLSLLVTRYFLREWMDKKLRNSSRMRSIEKAVAKEGWKIVFLTRLSPLMPFSLINYALGLSNISAVQFLLATELGALPSICVYVYAGTLIGNLARIVPELHQHQSLEWIVQGCGLIITVGVTIYIARKASLTLKRHLN